MMSLKKDQSGLTLIELMVTLFVLSIVMTGLTAGVIAILRATSYVSLSTDDQNQARTAVEVISRDIRAASPVRPSTDPAFLVAQPNEAYFTANLEDSVRPRLVRLFIDDQSRMVEDATPPESPTGPVTWDPDNDAVVRFIAAFVVNDDDLPIFRYFDQNGNELTYSTSPCTGPAGEEIEAPCLDADRRNQIAQVSITLTISSDPGDRVARFTVSQRIRLPNA